MQTRRVNHICSRDKAEKQVSKEWFAQATDCIPLRHISSGSSKCVLLLLSLLSTLEISNALGYMSTIAASYGTQGVVCAIEASREQQVLCWGRSSSQVVTFSTSAPEPFLALSGGNNFMCGLRAQTLQPFCWQGNNTSQNLTPQMYQQRSYLSLAAGEYHVCGLGNNGSDCWRVDGGSSTYPHVSSSLDSIVAGNGFTCGVDSHTKTAVCWGERILIPPSGVSFETLAAGRSHVCGVVLGTRFAECWGDNSKGQASPPSAVPFTAITAGFYHTCGILNVSHEVLCWGGSTSNETAVPLGIEFLALTAAEKVTCGVRESNLLAVCWGLNDMDYQPPLQLFSPGICSTGQCGRGEFAFNLSLIDSTSGNICIDDSQRICLPCAESCSAGTFLSAPCSQDADRECTDCSLCRNSLCQGICLESSTTDSASERALNQSTVRMKTAVAIISAATAGAVLLIVVAGAILFFKHRRRGGRYTFFCCGCKPRDPAENGLMQGSSCATSMSGATRKPSHEMIRTQAFRLTELRDATNGFKEVNELGRGSYGFVYRATLPDGRQAAVKRANAARRIHCNSRDFEAELEILCKVRHAHLVNLVGYCEEMGERLLVYEFMPNGTLHDHLHGGLAQLNWSLRFKIAIQSARGLDYLHKDAVPHIIHKDIKSSNILLDGDWNARVADFGLSRTVGSQIGESKEDQLKSPLHHFGVGPYTDPVWNKTQMFTEMSDVYSFGVVLLETLCGRKAYDTEYNPPSIVEWATKEIQKGKAAGILDRTLELPKNVEPLLRMAEIAELCVRPVPDERPSISDVALWLELVGRGSICNIY